MRGPEGSNKKEAASAVERAARRWKMEGTASKPEAAPAQEVSKEGSDQPNFKAQITGIRGVTPDDGVEGSDSFEVPNPEAEE